MQFDFTDVYLYMTSEEKKASDMQATGKGCISAKLLSLGKETLLSLAAKLCIYV